jgi:hypothetical protein
VCVRRSWLAPPPVAGNVNFVDKEAGPGARVNPECEDAARTAAELLGLEYDDMASALTSRKIYVGNEAMTTFLDVAKVCRALYVNLCTCMFFFSVLTVLSLCVLCTGCFLHVNCVFALCIVCRVCVCRTRLRRVLGASFPLLRTPLASPPHLPPLQASDARDGLVKSVYSKMFDWIVSMVNENIRPTEPHSMFIGVLDIFGFEVRGSTQLVFGGSVGVLRASGVL